MSNRSFSLSTLPRNKASTQPPHQRPCAYLYAYEKLLRGKPRGQGRNAPLSATYIYSDNGCSKDWCKIILKRLAKVLEYRSFLAADGYAAPKALVGITCPTFLWFQNYKWSGFCRHKEFKNHHKNLRIIKIFWNHLPVSGHFATFSGFARKFYIVLQPWLTHGQPVHDRRCPCQ